MTNLQHFQSISAQDLRDRTPNRLASRNVYQKSLQSVFGYERPRPEVTVSYRPGCKLPGKHIGAAERTKKKPHRKAHHKDGHSDSYLRAYCYIDSTAIPSGKKHRHCGETEGEEIWEGQRRSEHSDLYLRTVVRSISRG